MKIQRPKPQRFRKKTINSGKTWTLYTFHPLENALKPKRKLKKKKETRFRFEFNIKSFITLFFRLHKKGKKKKKGVWTHSHNTNQLRHVQKTWSASIFTVNGRPPPLVYSASDSHWGATTPLPLHWARSTWQYAVKFPPCAQNEVFCR